MGRGDSSREKTHLVAASRFGSGVRSETEEALDRLERSMILHKERFLQASQGGNEFSSQLDRKASAMSYLNKDVRSQKLLVKIAQDTRAIVEAEQENPGERSDVIIARAESIGNTAREIFVLSHTGYVMSTIRRHVGALESEDEFSALEVLRQEAYDGLNYAMDKYEFTFTDSEGVEHEQEAAPLTYAVNKIRAKLSDARESGQLIRTKSKAFDVKVRVESIVGRIETEGRPVTAAEVAERAEITPEKATEVLATLQKAARLDAPLAAQEGSVSMGEIIPDGGLASMDDMVAGDDQQNVVREVVKSIKSPLARNMIELYYGVNRGGDGVDQKNLYSGVYRDKEGQAYSAEATVLSERSKGENAENVIHKSQRELNERFAGGDLIFEAGTPESFELAMMRRREATDEDIKIDRDLAANRIITNETGIPVTSGNVQHIIRQAEYEMSQNPILKGIALRYRGNDELEQSLAARKRVREALVAVGAVKNTEEAEKLKAGRAAKDGSAKKLPLRVMAEQHNFVDERGRLNIAEIDRAIGAAA